MLGAHEGPVVAMADGYARATGRPAFVSLHVAAGTANGAIGMLNALRSRTPLVVLAGQQDSRHLIQDPMLSGDLVGLAQAATKWAVEARRADEVPTLLRRAFRAAVTPPAGPVFLSVPMDLFDEELQRPVPLRTDLPPVHPVADLTPAVEPAVVRSLASRGGRRRRGTFRGRRRAGACRRDARRAGLPRADERLRRLPDGPRGVPRHAGARERQHPSSVLDKHDVVLLAGVRAFVPHHYNDSAAVGPGTRLVQVDDDPSQVGRNYPAEVGLVGDVRIVLDGLATSLEASRPADQRAREPLAVLEQPPVPDDHDPAVPSPARRRHGCGEPARRSGRGRGGDHHGSAAARAPSTLAEPGSFHHTVGGGLGWGAGAAIGVALGRPGRRVVAALGDGCTLFGVQGLVDGCSRARAGHVRGLREQEYRTLKQTLTRMRGGRVEPASSAWTWGRPRVDWPALAESFGVSGERAESVDHLAAVLDQRTADDPPLLVEVPIESFGGEG